MTEKHLTENLKEKTKNIHIKEFEKMKARLLEEGYTEKEVTLSSGKAMVLGVLYSLPFVIICGLLYRFLLIDKAHLLAINGLSFYIMFIVIIVISVVIHELLHGIGWAISSSKGWNVVHFNISAMMPSCACKVALKRTQYLIGVLMPFAILGLGSVIFMIVYPGTISLLTIMVNFVSAGADLIIAFKAFKEKDCLIVDHPTDAGFIVFKKRGTL